MAIDARYFEPKTVEEACQVLSEYGGGAKIVAGGQGIVLPLRTFRVRPQAIVNVLNVAGLRDIDLNNGSGLRIGALVTLRDLENSPLVQQRCPALHEAVKAVADVQIRNAATLGGHLAAAHPASDIAPVLMSLKATVTALSTRESRTIALDSFFTDAFKTALQPDELITQIDVPPQPARTSSGYARFTIRDGDYPIVGAAATVTLGEDGNCCEARLVLTSVGLTPAHAAQAEQRLIGSTLTDEVIRDAARIASEEINPTGEIMASAEYEKHLVGVMARYALTKAMSNVQ
jgi:CO/xanthine dehydrogenase FAD-binding subunit